MFSSVALELDELADPYDMASIVELLRTRYQLGLGHVAISSSKMITLEAPYEDGSLYSREASEYFLEKGFYAASSYDHVFGLACNVFRTMLMENADQEAIICGQDESRWRVSRHFLKQLLVTSKFTCPEHENIAIKIMGSWELFACFIDIRLSVDLQFNDGHLKGAVFGVDNLGCTDAGWLMGHLRSDRFATLLKACKYASGLLLALDETVKIIFQVLYLVESTEIDQIIGSKPIAKSMGLSFKEYKSKLGEIELGERKTALVRFVISSFLLKLQDLVNGELIGKGGRFQLIKVVCGRDRTGQAAKRIDSKKLFDPALINFDTAITPLSPKWLILVTDVCQKNGNAHYNTQAVFRQMEQCGISSLLADAKTESGYHSQSLDQFCRKYQNLIKIHLEKDSFVEEISLIYGLGETDLYRRGDQVYQSRAGLKRLDEFCNRDPLQQVIQCLPSSFSDNQKKQKGIFRARKIAGSIWRAYAWFCTCLIPEALLIYHLNLKGFSRADQKNRIMAWREKIGFCLFILTISTAFLVFMIGTTRILCPSVFTSRSLSEFYALSRGDDPHVLIGGKIYNVGKIAKMHNRNGAIERHVWQFAGEDASSLFPRPSDSKPRKASNLQSRKASDSQPRKATVEADKVVVIQDKKKQTPESKGPHKAVKAAKSKAKQKFDNDLRICGEKSKRRRKWQKRKKRRCTLSISSSSSSYSALSSRSITGMPLKRSKKSTERTAPISKASTKKRSEEKPFVHSFDALRRIQNECKTFDLVLQPKDVGRTERNAQIIVFGRVYSVRDLIAKGKESGMSEMGLRGLKSPWGVDRSAHFSSFPEAKADLAILEDYFAGTMDQRDCLSCRLSSHLIVGSSLFLLTIVLIKLFAAFQQLLWGVQWRRSTSSEKKPGDKFVIIQVPCFTEGKEALRSTLNSLAMLRYDDKRKLLFIVADGLVAGKGNGKSTPEILKELLGIDSEENEKEPASFAYQSVTTGVPNINRCRVYSGLYECSGQRIPFLLLVKIGSGRVGEEDLLKPGNRGKRDSQMILFRFLARLYNRQPFCPLEVEIYRQIKSVIGIDPNLYEFVMMVDADTQVHSESLSRMVEMCQDDDRLIGVCGESRLSNEKATWVTAIQVYEYFISHNMNKAFESLFGSVTCLPGCFCMYRVKDGPKPYLIHQTILEFYGKTAVTSLHWKNLLSLGEDRYLTTLMLKHFPRMNLQYCPKAICWTAVPETWSVLLSQRRRWINSTIHNLFELFLLPSLCGLNLSIFSMRFVVILDLLGTLLMPAGLVYLAHLIYESIVHQYSTSTLSLLLLVAVYALQSLIFMAKREWQYIGWLCIHILSIPLSGFVIPLYAYWRYDELGWGATRKVFGPQQGEQRKLFENYDGPVAEVMRLKPFSEYSKDPEKAPWPLPSSSPGQASGAEAFLSQLFQSADLTMMTKRQARNLLGEHLGMDPQRNSTYLDTLIDQYIHSVYT